MERLRSKVMSAAPSGGAPAAFAAALSSGSKGAAAEYLLSNNAFYFQKRSGRLDMRSIARLDIDRVIREVDIDTLQLHLENLAFSEVRQDDMQFFSDEHFLKLVQLSQLTVEYLLNVQDTLAENLDDLARNFSTAQQEFEAAQLQSKYQEEKIHRLRREVKQQRRSIAAYEALLSEAQAAPRPPPARAEPAPAPEPAVKAAGISLVVYDAGGGCVTVRRLSADWTVGALKAHLASRAGVGIAEHRMVLKFYGRDLDDACTLGDEQVRDGSQLMMLERGGPREILDRLGNRV